jgi:hypothetical protein
VKKMAQSSPSPAFPNLRPLAIFSSYMILAALLTVITIRTILQKAKSSSYSLLRISIFSVLASLSLATTWFYMYQFFALSYRTWALNGYHKGVDGLQLGEWLGDSQLFEEAWGTACATPQRYWWTQQIFLLTTFWSLILGAEGNL